jgi:hypothetical protein
MASKLEQRLRRHVQVLAGDIGERHVWRPRALRAAGRLDADQRGPPRRWLNAGMTSDNLKLIEAVWRQGRAVPLADPAQWRQDACGAWMRREQFGHEDAEFAWKLVNVSAGGPDTAENLRPFHRGNAYDVASGRSHCAIAADRSNLPAEKYAMPPRNRPA